MINLKIENLQQVSKIIARAHRFSSYNAQAKFDQDYQIKPIAFCLHKLNIAAFLSFANTASFAT